MSTENDDDETSPTPKETRINLRISKNWKERFEKFVIQINTLLEEALTPASMIKNLAWFHRLLWTKSPYISEESHHILLIRNREYIYYKTDNLLLNTNLDRLQYIPMYVSMKTSIIRRVRNEENFNDPDDALARSIKKKWKINKFWLYDRKDERLVDHAEDKDGLTYKYVELQTHPRVSRKLRRESLVVLDLYGKEATERNEWSYDTASFDTDIPSKNMHILVVFEGSSLEHGGRELILEIANREGVAFDEGRAKRLLMEDVDFDCPKRVRVTKIKKHSQEEMLVTSSKDRQFIQTSNQYIKKINEILEQHEIPMFPNDINDESLVFYGLKIPMPPTDLMYRLKWPTPIKK